MNELDRHLSQARLSQVPLRVSVELGHSSRSLSQAVDLPAGYMVKLESKVDDPVEVYVDGLLYGKGRLTLVDGHWAVRLEEILVDSKPDFLDAADLGQEVEAPEA